MRTQHNSHGYAITQILISAMFKPPATVKSVARRSHSLDPTPAVHIIHSPAPELHGHRSQEDLLQPPLRRGSGSRYSSYLASPANHPDYQQRFFAGNILPDSLGPVPLVTQPLSLSFSFQHILLEEHPRSPLLFYELLSSLSHIPFLPFPSTSPSTT